MTQNKIDPQLVELNDLLTELERRKKYNKLAFSFPDAGPYRRALYSKFTEFFRAGNLYRERLLLAANRVGKTFACAYESTLHLTGIYPVWWEGKRFTSPISMWAAGKTNEATRDIIQEYLFGKIHDLGTGMIPKENIVRITMKPGAKDAILSAEIKHYDEFGVCDGTSDITLKSYEQGADKFQGTSRHVIWLDEEPNDIGIVSECGMRLTKTADFPGGVLLFSFTPLFGLSQTVLEFCPGGTMPKDHVNPINGKWSMQVTWDDVPHLTEEEKAERLKSIPPWEREARTKGIPAIGSGAIYTIPEADIMVQPFTIPDHWPRFYAMDVGFKNTAVLWFAEDPTTKTWYIYKEHYRGRTEPVVHAADIKREGEWIPGVIDPASNRTRDDGSRLLNEYMDLGLVLYKANNAVETGLTVCVNALGMGRVKIFSSCTNFFMEYRCYHKIERNGKYVIPDGQMDHAMDAFRYGMMSGVQIARVNPAIEDNERNDDWGGPTDLGANSITGY